MDSVGRALCWSCLWLTPAKVMHTCLFSPPQTRSSSIILRYVQCNAQGDRRSGPSVHWCREGIVLVGQIIPWMDQCPSLTRSGCLIGTWERIPSPASLELLLCCLSSHTPELCLQGPAAHPQIPTVIHISWQWKSLHFGNPGYLFLG